jgi:hypothetical protein
MMYTESGWCILASVLLTAGLLGNVVMLSSHFEFVTRGMPQFMASYIYGVITTSGLAAIWIAVIPIMSLRRMALRIDGKESTVPDSWVDPRDEVRRTGPGVLESVKRFFRGRLFGDRPLNTAPYPTELDDVTECELPCQWRGRESTMGKLFDAHKGSGGKGVGTGGIPADVSLEQVGV